MKATTEQLTAKDLALYLGCEAKVNPHYYTSLTGKDIHSWMQVLITTKLLHTLDASTRIKPILRPLSDMTEEHEKEYDRLQVSHSNMTVTDARCTLYFIRQGFDVFGWIEKGWAIDKAKI